MKMEIQLPYSDSGEEITQTGANIVFPRLGLKSGLNHKNKEIVLVTRKGKNNQGSKH